MSASSVVRDDRKARILDCPFCLPHLCLVGLLALLQQPEGQRLRILLFVHHPFVLADHPFDGFGLQGSDEPLRDERELIGGQGDLVGDATCFYCTHVFAFLGSKTDPSTLLIGHRLDISTWGPEKL